MQANFLPVGAATSALSAATSAASATSAQPGTLLHAATAAPAALLNMGSTTNVDLKEAAAGSQPSPLKHVSSSVSQQVLRHQLHEPSVCAHLRGRFWQRAYFAY